MAKSSRYRHIIPRKFHSERKTAKIKGKPAIYCEACNSEKNIVKNGIRNSKQRYKCNNCGVTFYEHGLVLSRYLMARQTIILTLLGYSKIDIAKTLHINENTVTRYIERYTQLDEFKMLIKLPYERTENTSITDVVDVKLKMYILKNWKEKNPSKNED